MHRSAYLLILALVSSYCGGVGSHAFADALNSGMSQKAMAMDGSSVGGGGGSGGNGGGGGMPPNSRNNSGSGYGNGGGSRKGGSKDLTERSSVLSINEAESYNSHHGLLLGKDRELFHASIDLRRAWSKLMDKESWISVFRSLVNALSHVSGADDSQMIFKEIAIDMLCDIRKFNPEASIKLFQGTIKQAEIYARRQGRFIVVYIEDAGGAGNRESRSSKASEQFRRAFSDPYLGSILNDEFVFFAGSSAHLPTYNIAKLLGYAKKDLPLFAILTPAYVEVPSLEKKRVLPEVVVTLRLSSLDIDCNKITRFLQRVLEVHGPILQGRKREHEAYLTTAVNLEKQSMTVARGQQEQVAKTEEQAKRRSILLKQLPPEAPQSDLDAVVVTIRLRNGRVAARRFKPSDLAVSIKRWADATGMLGTGDESELVTKNQQTNFVISDESAGKRTIKELGLTRDTVVSVQRPGLSK